MTTVLQQPAPPRRTSSRRKRLLIAAAIAVLALLVLLTSPLAKPKSPADIAADRAAYVKSFVADPGPLFDPGTSLEVHNGFLFAQPDLYQSGWICGSRCGKYSVSEPMLADSELRLLMYAGYDWQVNVSPPTVEVLLPVAQITYWDAYAHAEVTVRRVAGEPSVRMPEALVHQQAGDVQPGTTVYTAEAFIRHTPDGVRVFNAGAVSGEALGGEFGTTLVVPITWDGSQFTVCLPADTQLLAAPDSDNSRPAELADC